MQIFLRVHLTFGVIYYIFLLVKFKYSHYTQQTTRSLYIPHGFKACIIPRGVPNHVVLLQD